MDTETVAIADLKAHPKNYRSHPDDQVEHLMKSIEQHGFYRNVVLARDGTILAGHGVVEACRRLGMESVSAVRLNIDPDSTAALKVLTGDNYLSHFASDDDRALAEILKLVKDEDPQGLAGTGFDEMMLANLVMVTRHKNEIADFDAAAEWAGAQMPEFDPGKKSINVVVEFLSEEDRAAFLAKLEVPEERVMKRGMGWSFWYPLRPKNDLESLRIEPAEIAS